jgi:hypothetical protein
MSKQATNGFTYKVSVGRLSDPTVGDNTVAYEFVIIARKNRVWCQHEL